MNSSDEIEAVRKRYSRRNSGPVAARYVFLRPYVWKSVQERQRGLVRLLSRHVSGPLDTVSLLEIGCGNGGNLLELLRMGFDPGKIAGNELLGERIAVARRFLPLETRLFEGDALSLDLRGETFDVIYQSTVFSSILCAMFQERLAEKIWSLVRPGGAVLWYDFVYQNPSNPDVVGVPLSRIRRLFPGAVVDAERITLAPPLGRFVTRLAPVLYDMCNCVPYLRTHLLCWIRKV